jgi:hypothetical protein
MMKKWKFLSKLKQNDRENVAIKFVFINFKHPVAITFNITNEHPVLLCGTT